MFAKAREAAADLVGKFAAEFPPTLQQLSGRKAQDMYVRALGALKTQASEAQIRHRFGIIARIVLARTFQAALKSQGYSGAILRQATSELASAITFAKK
jgi:hypothetical protein